MLTRVRAMLAAVLLLCLAGLPDHALAQVTQYTNTTSGTISETATPCTSPLVRTFTVPTSFTVSDVNIGVRLAHTYRGDLRLYLVSPAGTSVTLMENIGGGVDNLNVLFDASAGAAIATHTASNDSATSGPPYERTFAPQSALSAFNGQNSAGIWELRACDSLDVDTGSFSRADLYLAQTPTTFADLSLTKTVSNAAPAFGASIIYTLTVTNAAASALTANGVTVNDVLPAGFTYVSHSAGGGSTFTPGSGVWAVGTLAPGGSRALTITGTVNATPGATVVNSAEIGASSAIDLDSTPGNDSISEDDDAQISFTVAGTRVAGTPPTLTCPAGTLLHDWDPVTWTAGSLNNSYSVAGLGSIDFAISISGGVFLNNAGFGGQNPALQTQVTGALSPVQRSLAQLVNMTSTAGLVTTVVTLPNGVAGAQFRIFDLDFGSGSFADKVTVIGSFDGLPVVPILTNGVVNYVIGNTAIGDAASTDTSGNGNVTVTFTSPVDSITIAYGNHSTAPANPGQQAIALHDFSFCRPVANLTVAKSSSIISDPQNGTTNPKAIPGAIIRYCITITNPDSGTASGIVVGDNIPATTSFVPASIRSGATCAGAATVEDDDSIGADESDPDGASIAGAALSATAVTIGPNSSRAFTFQVIVN